MEQWQIILMFSINLIAVVTGVSKGLSVLMSVRDELRDLTINVGHRQPPSGLLGDVQNLKTELQRHRDTLIEVSMELGMRPPGGRT